MILLDTDHLSVLTDRRAAGNDVLVSRLVAAGDPPALPIVAIEEQCKGWLAKLGRTRDIHQQIIPYRRLAEFFDFLAEWDVIPLSGDSANHFASLRRQKIRVGTQDLKIAAIAIAENALLLSANLVDFKRCPGCRSRIGCCSLRNVLEMVLTPFSFFTNSPFHGPAFLR